MGYAHPGSIEAALNGYAPGKTAACRESRYYLHKSCEREVPMRFPQHGGPSTRWHEIRATFRDAFNKGQLHDLDPVAEDDKRWVARLWMSDEYWLVVGGRIDASIPEDPIRVELPGLSAQIDQAWEIDVYDATLRPAVIERKNDRTYVTVKSSFSAVLLPFAECPPLLDIKATGGILEQGMRLDDPLVGRRALRRGESIGVSLAPFAPWRTGSDNWEVEVRINAYGLEQSVERAHLPATVTINAPETARSGNYLLRVTGDCLELKRRILVE
jgi:hypothetical protein